MIPRILTKTIQKAERPGFVTIVYGPRRVGKTVLIQQLTDGVPKKELLWFNGDTQEARDALSTSSQTALSRLVSDARLVVIDEAQRIPGVGLALKILIDTFPEKRWYVSGSSSLMLSRGVHESLTGRNMTFKLYPFSTRELTTELPDFQKSAILPDQLRFGGYPYLLRLHRPDEKKTYLKSVTRDYLFRDVFALKDIAAPEKLTQLATLLAFQIGHEVSFGELSRSLGLDVKTVARYIGLLKESFVVFELSAWSRNLRKEVAKSKKYFFWDLGIRNALTDQFQPLTSRTDVGQLWENFLAVERMKRHEYGVTGSTCYFWRTYEQAEVDWVEVTEGNIQAYEFKWRKGKTHTPKAFRDAYSVEVQGISRENYLDFV